MAGTRRRSRISDTAVVQDLSSTSRAASSIAESRDEQKHDDGAGVPARNDHDNVPSPQAPVNRSTTAFCKKCSEVVGEFYNSWHKITGTYYLPTLLGSYSSRLRAHGRQKAASLGTDLDGCQIQPLACPSCSDTLGFTAVDAPESKQTFRGRDFFKLPRIDLKCEYAPKKFKTVEPQVDAAPDPLPAEDSDKSSLVPEEDMEVDARPSHASQPPPPPPSGLLPQHHHDHHHQPLQQVEANRQPLPPPVIHSPSALVQFHGHPQKSPSNAQPSPVQKPIHDVQYVTHPPTKEVNVNLANRTRDPPPVISHSPAESHRPNGQYYPRSPPEVQLDAIERLQTQISQNSGALMVHGRDLRRFEETVQRQGEGLQREFQSQLNHQGAELRRVDEAVGRLQHEMRGIRDLLEALTREVQITKEMQAARPVPAAVPGPSATVQDTALELMNNQISAVSQKANEVDTLKITIEIMRSKIQRLEEAAAAAPPPPQSTTHAFPSPHEPSAHSAHSSHTVPSYHNTPSAVPHINTPVHPAHRPASFHSHESHASATPEVSQKAETAQTQSGWVPINSTSVKRAHPNGIDGPHESIGQPVGSPKRPKLAPIEPRVAYGSSQAHPAQQHIVYDHMDTDDSEPRVHHSHSMPPSQTQSRESLVESTIPSQTPPTFIAYGTQEAPPDDSWRSESQRLAEHRSPRGRGRGGGPGSRGGRPRKSMVPTRAELGTPEWEREDWQGVTDSQTSPDGFYNPVARSGRGIIRRGSGGGGGASRGSRPTSASGRAVSLGLQGVTTGPGVGLPNDPYAHTKKTRTKPIRNADGILIRKDGRPDMRSQSSAANLRKVHARKEEQKSTDRSFTPTSGLSTNLHHTTNMGAETPSPTGVVPGGQDATASAQKKHAMIMNKMFPHGIDESRREHDYARQVFESDQGHTAHPRGHHHEIKREHFEERRVVDSQSPNEAATDGDVDMDRAEDHADDEGQTPSDRSDNSGRESQYHDANTHEEEKGNEEAKENGVQVQGTGETSQTIDVIPRNRK
ncbi:hypothetical protein K469DRAFT_705651 [Zopfia rhizophila CBS 207.26]|uniref:Uncharacterized protein n=1 Tax=Zopfia rhizophila CBS 207.26 TaxID=1314779 RepID=A0A6A6EB88_9PEZI|nr:hypothetical protein K469DRAFT_705651 [Zopfia rhizophila CBS 207.26]